MSTFLAASECKWRKWSPWGPCSASCGIGYQMRKRSLKRAAQFGGGCRGKPFQKEECYNAPCPGKLPKVNEVGPSIKISTLPEFQNCALLVSVFLDKEPSCATFQALTIVSGVRRITWPSTASVSARSATMPCATLCAAFWTARRRAPSLRCATWSARRADGRREPSFCIAASVEVRSSPCDIQLPGG